MPRIGSATHRTCRQRSAWLEGGSSHGNCLNPIHSLRQSALCPGSMTLLTNSYCLVHSLLLPGWLALGW
jgi:hypothetical protein